MIESITSYSDLPIDQKMTSDELKCFQCLAVGEKGSRKDKHIIFNSGFPKLVRLNSLYYTHIPINFIDQSKNKTVQRNCAVCLVTRKKFTDKKTSKMCKICAVPLCIKPKGRSVKSCFEKWHETDDLEKLRIQLSWKNNFHICVSMKLWICSTC